MGGLGRAPPMAWNEETILADPRFSEYQFPCCCRDLSALDWRIALFKGENAGLVGMLVSTRIVSLVLGMRHEAELLDNRMDFGRISFAYDCCHSRV